MKMEPGQSRTCELGGVCSWYIPDAVDTHLTKIEADYAALVQQNAALVKALTYVRDDLDWRYDGAPDSRVLWMGLLMRDIDAALAQVQKTADDAGKQ